MNDRIRQLADEAGITDNNLSDGNMSHDDLAKFARLIVRECALLCVSRPGPGDDIRSREHCSEQILQHFGVEE